VYSNANVGVWGVARRRGCLWGRSSCV